MSIQNVYIFGTLYINSEFNIIIIIIEYSYVFSTQPCYVTVWVHVVSLCEMWHHSYSTAISRALLQILLQQIFSLHLRYKGQYFAQYNDLGT
jgi:hypothetical protein